MTWLVRGREGVELEVGWSEGVVGNTGSSVGGIGKVSGFFSNSARLSAKFSLK